MLNDKVKIVWQKSLTQALQAKSELASLCHAKLYEFYFTKEKLCFIQHLGCALWHFLAHFA